MKRACLWGVTLGVAILQMSLPRLAPADVITLTNGKVIKGVLQEPPEDPTIVIVEMGSTKQTILKSRISNIEKTSQAQSYIDIGQGFRERGQLADALKQFQRALELEPANAAAQQALAETEAAIAEQNKVNRAEAVSRIDDLRRQATDAIRKGNFAEAEAMVKQANQLGPDPQQRQAIARLLSELYLGWAEEREDKYDMAGSEEKLNLALAANPDNERVIAKMLALWENDPSKREQSAGVYEAMLEKHPDDDNLRKKLADLYFDMARTEDATRHYLVLYQASEAWKGTPVEERVKEGLDKLHLQFARAKNYDQAIFYYNKLAAIDPETDPSAVIRYQYLNQANATAPDDIPGQLALAQYCEKYGLHQEAQDIYRRVLATQGVKPELQQQAQAGLDRYAQQALNDAQARLQNGDYLLAKALAEQVRAAYPQSQKIGTAAMEIIGQATALIARDTRQRREVAQDIIRRADEFYGQGMFFYNQIYNSERRDLPRLGSARSDAVRYFRYAIQAYEDALRTDPTLATQSNSLVMVHLNESKNYLNRLTQALPTPRNLGRYTNRANRTERP